MYDREFLSNLSQYSWKMFSGYFFEAWCIVPIQKCSYLVFADLGCGDSIVVFLVRRRPWCVEARRLRRYSFRIHSIFPSWIGRSYSVGQNAVMKICLVPKRENDRHVVGKNEEVSWLYHVLEMFHCFVNRQELLCFNATMRFLQKKAIYCYVFCKLFFFCIAPMPDDVSVTRVGGDDSRCQWEWHVTGFVLIDVLRYFGVQVLR